MGAAELEVVAEHARGRRVTAHVDRIECTDAGIVDGVRRRSGVDDRIAAAVADRLATTIVRSGTDLEALEAAFAERVVGENIAREQRQARDELRAGDDVGADGLQAVPRAGDAVGVGRTDRGRHGGVGGGDQCPRIDQHTGVRGDLAQDRLVARVETSEVGRDVALICARAGAVDREAQRFRGVGDDFKFEALVV